MSYIDEIKKQLVRYYPNLPRLPPQVNKALGSSTIRGLMAQEQNRYLLLNQVKNGYSWGVPAYGQTFDPKLKANSTRRKLMVMDKTRTGWRASMNKSLSGGGGGNPVLDTLLGLAAGAVSAPVGLIWTGMTFVISISQREQQPVRVRNGDEIYQVETVGWNGNKLEHMELIILVDPYRVKANSYIQQWIIHDERTEIIFPQET